MIRSLIYKGSAAGLLLLLCGLSVSAQKIDEQVLKINVEELPSSLQHIKALKPVTFKYDNKKFKYLNLSGGKQYGFITSNVHSQFPELVYEASRQYEAGKNNTKVVKYDEVYAEALIPILVSAVKEQQEQIEFLKVEINQLKLKSK